MTVTIQKELAERITARPGSKDYGALSIWVQAQCRAEILRILPPEVFLAAAEGLVSAFLQITLDETLRRRIPDRKFFHEFVRAMFLPPPQVPPLGVADRRQRAGWTSREVDAMLARLNLAGTVRAEQLDVDTFLGAGQRGEGFRHFGANRVVLSAAKNLGRTAISARGQACYSECSEESWPNGYFR